MSIISPTSPGLPSTSFGASHSLRGPEAGLSARQDEFAAVIGRKGYVGKLSREEQAREAAEDFVSISFVQPLLAQLRSTNNAAPPFAPSRGEQQFQSLADAQLARRIVHASNFPLVDRLAQDLLKQGGSPVSAPRAATTTPEAGAPR